MYLWTRTLSQYIDHLGTLCKRLYINHKAKLYHFTNGFKHHLKKALLVLEPPDLLTKERQPENEIWLVPEIFLFFPRKALYELKANGQYLSFKILAALNLDIPLKQSV